MSETNFKPVLSLRDATMIVAGSMIGSGIFIVSADITDDGKEVLVKNYSAIYYYKRVANETIEQALAKPYATLSYKVEPQGEAISFAQDGSGFFTISEKAFWNNVQLYFYKRK